MATDAAIAGVMSAHGETTQSSSPERIVSAANRPVDGSSLALFRILFGSVMAFAMVRLLAKGWVRELYLDPSFHFTWEWFPWVKVLPGAGMYVLVGALALLAIGMAAGWRFRLCAGLFFCGFTYLELIDQTTYLNHYYLVSLLSGLLFFLPADAVWSWHARQHGDRMVPVSAVWLLRYQIALVYVFAGIAKLNADWLLEAQPMRIWLAARSDLPLIGPLLAKTWVAYAASWTGAVYDLTIPFWLMWTRSRPWAYLAVVGFHVMTAVLFHIGMFPWVMMVTALIFFPPDWARGLIRKHRTPNIEHPTSNEPSSWRLQYVGLFILVAYAVVQLMLPLRSFLYPQQGAWDGRGFNFAWRVMLAEKTGYVEFYAFDPVSGQRERLGTSYLITPRQRVMMAQDPGMIRQLACRLAEELPAQGKAGWEVRVEARATLNGHPSQRIIRPDVNLAGPLPADWIVPLKEN